MTILDVYLSTDNPITGGDAMSTRKTKRELVGIWQVFHLIIWMGGLYYLLTRGQIFPGILVLVLISGVYEALLRRYVPRAYEESVVVETAAPAAAMPASPPVDVAPPAPAEHRLELLPQVCPSCSGPIRGHEVKWTGPQSANCPYCGTNLPMSKE
jgi:hypothetical protein